MNADPIARTALVAELVRILKPYWKNIVLAIVAGAASGLATTGLLATINTAMHLSDPLSPALILSFIALCAIVLVGEITAELASNFVGQSGVTVLRHDLCERVLAAPIRRIEIYGTSRILAILNQDVDMISMLFFNAAGFAISAAVTVACFVYLLSLAPLFGLIGVGVVVLGAAIHFMAVRRSYQGFEESRNGEDDLQTYLRTICEGAKELRMDRSRRAHILNTQVAPVLKRIQDTKYGSMRVLAFANSAGSLLYFLVVGLIVILAAAGDTAPEVVSAFVLTLLFVRGPITQIAQLIPFFAQAKIAFGRVLDFSAGFREREALPDISADTIDRARMEFAHIELSNIRFRYPDQRFAIGPLGMKIRRGERLFIIGENGGGKTTFAKLLLGLYPPDAGEILLDGKSVVPAEIDSYRQLFVTVFTDFHLFADLSPEESSIDPRRVETCLQRLRLEKAVTFQKGRLSTTDLSTGQRKRLALLHAWLSNRPIIVFDEWAADQDPEFRSLFYQEILPELKAEGRTIIAIVHDDRYFNDADVTVRFTNGELRDAHVIVRP